jgi:hypothetical protein
MMRPHQHAALMHSATAGAAAAAAAAAGGTLDPMQVSNLFIYSAYTTAALSVSNC